MQTKFGLNKVTQFTSLFPYSNKSKRTGSSNNPSSGRKATHPYLREGFVFKCCKSNCDNV